MERILFIIPSLYGGLGRVVMTLADHMSNKMGLNVSILTMYHYENSYEISEKIKIYSADAFPNVKMWKRPILFYRRMRYIRNFLKKNQFCKIFSFMFSTNICAIFSGKAIVVSDRTSFFFYSKFSKILLNLYRLKHVKKIIVQTDVAKKYLLSRGIRKAEVIVNPLGLRSYSQRSSFNHYLSLINEYSPSSFFLAVGRLAPEKNFLHLIRAFSEAKSSNSYTLLIAGCDDSKDQAEYKRLINLITELKLFDRVKLLGIKNDDELDWLYRNAYVTILSSLQEAFPNVLVESLSRGTPVIATDCLEGPAAIVVPEKNGLLVSLSSVSDMANAIDRMVLSPGLRNECSKYARESVEKHFDIDGITKQWLGAF